VPRFVPEHWKPKDDSSEGYATLDPDAVVLNVGIRQGSPGCPCGCGDFPMSDTATFAMGHDARLRGKLIRAHLMGVPIRYHIGGILGDPIEASALADQYYWTSYLDSAVLKRDGRNREILRRAMGKPTLVRVGRWPLTGQVAAIYDEGNGTHLVEYVNQAGDVRKIKVAADREEAK
jgi:hypothetical protein